MRSILVPVTIGVGISRHLFRYLSYQVTGGARNHR